MPFAGSVPATACDVAAAGDPRLWAKRRHHHAGEAPSLNGGIACVTMRFRRTGWSAARHSRVVSGGALSLARSRCASRQHHSLVLTPSLRSGTLIVEPAGFLRGGGAALRFRRMGRSARARCIALATISACRSSDVNLGDFHLSRSGPGAFGGLTRLIDSTPPATHTSMRRDTCLAAVAWPSAPTRTAVVDIPATDREAGAQGAVSRSSLRPAARRARHVVDFGGIDPSVHGRLEAWRPIRRGGGVKETYRQADGGAAARQ